jgi:hypothetical protein
MGSKMQENLTQGCGSFSGWDRAILEAQRQIDEASEKIRKLNLSIETFKEMQAKGEPFPSET